MWSSSPQGRLARIDPGWAHYRYGGMPFGPTWKTRREPHCATVLDVIVGYCPRTIGLGGPRKERGVSYVLLHTETPVRVPV